ncbi:MAG: GTP-binding protein [Bacteroidales bacterium]|nr:GTP-binding protein [Bacteroidales bacterium]
MSKIPFYIVTGFLGGGKTTFLKHFLHTFSGRYRIGVIQNEFAPGQVDGAELRREEEDFELLEINKGSAFCVCLLNDFTRSLKSFIGKYCPDILLLEASGLADPIAVAEVLQGSELFPLLYLSYIWTIVDAENFEKTDSMITRVERQVRVADKILINKTDKHPAPLDPVIKKLRTWNPFAAIEAVTFARATLDNLDELKEHEPHAIKKKEEHRRFEPLNKPGTGTVALKTTWPISRQNLENFIREMLPLSYRIKGTVKLDDGTFVSVQAVMGEVEYREAGKLMQPTELIAIGPGITPKSFGKRFHEYRKKGG